MEDFSFKSLALTGMILGSGFWMLSGSKASKDSREPTAVEKIQAKVMAPTDYKPDIPMSGGRDGESPVRVEADLVEGAPENEMIAIPNEATSDFLKTREEISTVLAQGDVEGALEIAERRLEENIKNQSPEIAYVGYLHEFIMQNSEDDQVEVDATISALRGTEDLNIRKHIYEKFQTYSPQLVEDLDRELGDAGIAID